MRTEEQKTAVAKAVKALNAITTNDKEEAHSESDRIVETALRELGFPIIADKWQGIAYRLGGFWYS